MLSKSEIRVVFEKRKAIIPDDHFVYAKKEDGWYHGTGYVNKDAIYPFVDDVEALCEVIAYHFFVNHGGHGVDVVIGPTVGAVSLAQWVTKWFHRFEGNDRVLAVCADEEDVFEPRKITLNIADYTPRNVSNVAGAVSIVRESYDSVNLVYKEKVGTQRVIKRGYADLVRGKRCLLVEDVVNSGITLAKTDVATVAAGGIVVGYGCLCDRSGGKVKAFAAGGLFSLLNVDMKMVKEELCPTCREKGRGSVRLDLGKGKDFLVRMGIKPGDK